MIGCNQGAADVGMSEPCCPRRSFAGLAEPGLMLNRRVTAKRRSAPDREQSRRPSRVAWYRLLSIPNLIIDQPCRALEEAARRYAADPGAADCLVLEGTLQ